MTRLYNVNLELKKRVNRNSTFPYFQERGANYDNNNNQETFVLLRQPQEGSSTSPQEQDKDQLQETSGEPFQEFLTIYRLHIFPNSSVHCHPSPHPGRPAMSLSPQDIHVPLNMLIISSAKFNDAQYSSVKHVLGL